MAEALYRLGQISARRAWVVVVVWVVLLAAAAGAYVTWGGTLATGVSIPGTATAEVAARLQRELPEASGGSGTVVFRTSDGSALTADQQAAITSAFQGVADIDGVQGVVDPFAVAAQRAEQEQALAEGLAQIEAARAQLDVGQAQLDAAVAQAAAAGLAEQVGAELDAQQAALDAARAEVDAQGAQAADGSALLEMAAAIRTVSSDGSAAVATVMFAQAAMEVSADTKDAIRAHLDDAPIAGVETDVSSELVGAVPAAGAAEIIGVAAAAVVLLVMLGTVVAAGLPLISALVGVGVAALGAMALSGSVDMMSATPMLGVMIGLAVGIDYSLFILNRHRRQLRAGMGLHQSIGLANGTSGTAVVFAGATVLIALVALNVTGIPFLGLMGSVAAAGVGIAVAVAVTLTPALLGLVGMRVLPRRQRPNPDHVVALAPLNDRPMRTRSAVLRLVGGIAVLLVIALPALAMRLGLPDGATEAQDSTQYRAYTAISEEFGAGVNGTLVVVADLPEGTSDTDVLGLQARIGTAIMAVPDVVAVAPIGTSQDNGITAFQVVPAEGPTSESTELLVRDLRALDVPDEPGVTVSVAGAASGNIDISEKLADALPLYLAVVIGLSLVILVLVFRSLLVPVVATGGFILSLFAAFGGVTAIYQWGWLSDVFGVHDPGPVLNFLPTILIGVLFGLAMDYQLFLAAGMREAYVHGSPAREAVTRGLHAGRAVVTAAAIIMAAVFGGFMFSHTAVIRPIGFALAFGVLLDAFVVRMVIVPAVMHLAGDKAWWLPRWLDGILPDVDVEGAALERHHVPQADPSDPDGAGVDSSAASEH